MTVDARSAVSVCDLCRLLETDNVTQNKQDPDVIHILHLLYPLVDVFGMKTMVLETASEL
mgnify:CR=1 FL=1|jgi:hypothetical protein